jgi:hypothetical protein
MKSVNLVISALIFSQGLFISVDAKAMNPLTLDLKRGELLSPLRQVKPLVAAFKYVRPKAADNGSPFPRKSGYIKGYPIQFKEGYSTLTVNNSKNSSDVFVKLYALDSMPPQPVRVFFIRKGEKFTAVNIKPGSYDVRYRDLQSGGLSRTDNFNLEEYKTFEGSTRFKRMTLTLYKVPGGNMKIHPLSEREF